MAFLASVGVRAAEPEPVMAGLWEVRLLAFFEPDPQPGAADWPGQPGKARSRKYRICLDASRARAPMSPVRLSPGAQRSSDKMTVLVRESASTAPRDDLALESLYRRLNEREFEGSHTLLNDKQAVTLQYSSIFVQPDCEGVRPAAMSRFGEP